MKKITATTVLVFGLLLLMGGSQLYAQRVNATAIQYNNPGGKVSVGDSLTLTKGLCKLRLALTYYPFGETEKKIKAIKKRLQKLGWEEDPPKDEAYKPDLILNMNECGFDLTVQAGGMVKISLKPTVTPRQIADEIHRLAGTIHRQYIVDPKQR